MKLCSKCGTVKPLTDFYKQASCKGGLRPECKQCNRAKSRQYHSDNRPLISHKRKAYQAQNKNRLNESRRRAYGENDGAKKRMEYYYANHEREKAKVRERNLNNPNKVKDGNLRRYGLTLGDYNEMVTAQDGCCLICGKPSPLEVDHDHRTGDVRGLLCRPCNLGLGVFADNIQSLKAAIDYLLAFASQKVS